MHQERFFKDKVWLHYIPLFMWGLHWHFVSPTICKSIKRLQHIGTLKDCGCRKMTAYGRKVKLIQFWPLMYDPCLYGLQSLWSAGSQLLLCPCHDNLYFLVVESSQLVLILDFISTKMYLFWGILCIVAPVSHENLHTGLWIKCKWSQRQAITSSRGRSILCDHYRQL